MIPEILAEAAGGGLRCAPKTLASPVAGLAVQARAPSTDREEQGLAVALPLVQGRSGPRQAAAGRHGAAATPPGRRDAVEQELPLLSIH